ncbi:MAG: hypothetical protein J6Z36_04720 [Clostridia bacterium]|nr:hypothetical protein [Clostridia bacterium]
MSEFFEFSMSLTGNTLMTTARLAVGGLSSAAGLDVDESEDFKVCVTESLLIFKRNGFQAVKARFTLADEELQADLTALSPAVDALAEESVENEISYALLGALVDETSFRKENGRVTGIVLTKKTV